MSTNQFIQETRKKQSLFFGKIKDNIFKSSMFIAIAVTMIFIAALVVFIFQAGSSTFINGGANANWMYFLTGNYYDGVTYFAAGFMLVNTIWTTILAIMIATPISIMTALFITRIAPKWLKSPLYFSITMLAAIPSVIYGAFGAKWIDESIKNTFSVIGGTTLTIIMTLTIMVLPTITLITTSAINSVDKKMEHSSLALGASRAQTSFYVTLKAASPGIMVAVILGIGRVMGEATAVSMVSTPSYSGPSFGLFDQIRLLTATMLSGRKEMAPGSIQEAMMLSMAMILLISIILIFLVMKFVEKKTNINEKAKREIHKNARRTALIEKVKTNGEESLSLFEKLLWKRYIINEKLWDELLKEENNELKFQKKFSAISSTTVNIVSNSSKFKFRQNAWMTTITALFSVFGVFFLGAIIIFLLLYGTSALSFSYLSNTEIGGLAIPMMNTLLSLTITMVIALPIGIASGIFFAEYIKTNGKIHKILGTLIDLLTGIPSLIFGIVGLMAIRPWLENSAAVALGITMSFMILPTIIRTTESALNSVRVDNKWGSLALGATRSKTSLIISVPQAAPQIISGAVLGIGRVIGESAATLMVFGLFAQGSVSESFRVGGTTLATEIYRLTSAEVVEWDKVAAIGIVIITMILIISMISKQLETKNWKQVAIMTVFSILTIISIITSQVGIFIMSLIITIGSPIIESGIKWTLQNKHFFDKMYDKLGISRRWK